HEHLAIQPGQFQRMAAHLAEALRSLGVKPSLIEEVSAVVAATQANIVNTPTVGNTVGVLPEQNAPTSGTALPSVPPSEANGATAMSTAPEGRTTPSSAAAANSNGQLDSLEFVRASLASVQANLFLTDTNFTILYANERAMETLRGIEDEIRKAFDIEVADVV